MPFYGVTTTKQIEDIVISVVGVLGGGSKAIRLMLGTCAAETNFGEAEDTHALSGYGLFQLDKIAIQDLKERTREHHRVAIEDRFGIYLDDIKPRDLNHSPLLAAICCRLHYKLVPDPIPADIEGRAKYWKKHYNKNGKGTPEHYIKRCGQLYGSDLYNALCD